MRLGFVGSGAITESIVKGLVTGNPATTGIVVSPRNALVANRLTKLSTLVRIGRDNQDVVDSTDIVFIAVLPQICDSVLSAIQFRSDQKVVSLVATVSHEKLAEWIPVSTQITRAIPLPAVADKRGITAIYPHDENLVDLFRSLGTVFVCDDRRQFDLVATGSALMGTYFGILGICQTWLLAMGMKEADSTAYLKALVLGLSEAMGTDNAKSFEDLRVTHTTPGGLNEQMFGTFCSNGGKDALEMGLASILKRIEDASI